jgi:predicted small lipoprotein YifL
MGRDLLRALVVIATGSLVVCGVKGPPHPPEPQAETAPAGGDAGATPGADAGAQPAAAADAGAR